MRFTIPVILFVLAIFSCKKNKEISEEPIPNNKAVTWAKTYGGTNYDFANAVVQLTDGNYVVAGLTRSVDGDILGGRVGYDAWLAKIDNAGSKLWSVTFGTNDDEYANAVLPVSEGGYLLVGHTFINYRNYAWIIKADGNGNQQWQKQLTQSNDAKPFSIISTSDGAYLVIGYHTTDSGNRNGWITKIDVNGDSLWTRTIGGSGEDQITSVVKAYGGGFIVTGYSNSSDLGVSGNKGNYDGWIMKIDENGNKVWDKTFGGSDEDYLKNIIQTNDGGYLAAGYTKSTNVDIPLNKGGYDAWLIKIDASGNKQWLKTYGGANEEYINTVTNTKDDSYLIAGYTNSTTGDVLRPNNNFSGWLLKLDGTGNKVATSTYGRTERYDDFTNTLIKTQDDGYMIAGYSYQEGRGYDAWLVKIADF